ncbi:MAG: bifunctional folylpolyglutamate synthase/dihydrofolate synthase [Lachnospiraceae bacterium]|nr:bifunctional folylpolyglutamate synthase/dihydrofolate synthase [Lachnospiraceae bacterium]
MNYTEVTEYVESLQGLGIVPGLSNITNLCEKLGNPQKELSFVHIAGTNGKGSVLAFVSTILKTAGYKTGRYISPTIFEYRERIQINGRMISKADLCRLMETVKNACDALVQEGAPHPTPFEVETALAFLYFKEKNCDIVVLETGMGGAEDATNLIENTLVCALVSISLDHMGILGDTLKKIATQKAGIIKNGCHVVSAPQDKEAARVIEEKCREKKAYLTFVDLNGLKKKKSTLSKQCFSYGTYKDLEISLIGRYQTENAAIAVEVIQALAKKGYQVSEKALRKGFLETQWPGRFDLLLKKPIFIADGAHNRDGAKRLAECIEFYFTNRRIIYIMGMLRDKEQEEVIQATYPFASQILTVPTKGGRGTSSYELAQKVQQYHENVTALDSVEEAVELSLLMADKDTVIIAFGSLSFLGQLMTVVKNRSEIRSDSHGK